MIPKQLALAGIGVSVAGAVTTGVYFVAKKQPVKRGITIKDALKRDGYIPLSLSDQEWQNKFNEFRDNDVNNPKLAAALHELDPEFIVTKNTENNRGGETLKNWCADLLKLEETKIKGQKNLDNAKVFCAKLKEPTSISQGTGLAPSTLKSSLLGI